MTPQECIDFLVDRVGHERDNATAEVRRSFTTSYGPLYQAAYLLGGLQLRALHRELVESGKMTDRDFHDRILKENAIPIDMVRALLAERKLTADYTPDWKFYSAPRQELTKPRLFSKRLDGLAAKQIGSFTRSVRRLRAKAYVPLVSWRSSTNRCGSMCRRD